MEAILKVRELREAKNMSQRQLAEAMRVTPGAVAKWELGYTKITMENLMALADLFGCTTDALLGREPPGPSRAS